jgi:non-ribosomal peptide synthetase component F
VDSASRPGEPSPDSFVVVVNDEGQHALWRAGLDLPDGWARASAAMARDECLAAIDGAWPDIAPASVRVSVRAGAAADGVRFAHEAFAEQAARRPDATAVIAGRTQLSYGELDASANRLARYIGQIGAGPETVIGVYLERGVDLIRAMLAIMKAGAGYLPIDPSLPPERVSAICSQVRPAAVIAARPGTFPGTGARLLPLGELTAELAGLPSTPPATGLGSPVDPEV